MTKCSRDGGGNDDWIRRRRGGWGSRPEFGGGATGVNVLSRKEWFIMIQNITNSTEYSPVTLSPEWSRLSRLLLLSALSIIGSVGNIFMISSVIIEDYLNKAGKLKWPTIWRRFRVLLVPSLPLCILALIVNLVVVLRGGGWSGFIFILGWSQNMPPVGKNN